MAKKQNTKIQELHPHPRPGLSYFIWILCILFNFYMFLVQFSAWDAAPSLLVEKGLPKLAVGNLLTSYNVAILIFQFPVALLIDKYGPKNMTSLVILFAALGVLMMGNSTTPLGFWLSTFTMGLGGTIAFVNTLKLVSNWFHPEKFTIMLAWTIFATIVGAIIGQPFSTHLISSFGWSKVMFNYGLIGILYALIFFLFVRDSQTGIRYRIVPNPKTFKLWKSVKKALKNGENYVLALFGGLAISQWFAFIGVWHIPFYKLALNVSAKTAGIFNIVSMVGFALGSIVFLYLATRLKKRKLIMGIGTLVALVFSSCSIYIPHLPIGLHVLFDCLTTFSISSSFLVYTMIHEKNIPAITATVIGMVTISLAVFRLLGEHSILWILKATAGPSSDFTNYTVADFQYALIVVPCSLILALIFLIFTKETGGKQVYED